MSPPDPLDSLLDRWGEAPETTALTPEVWRRLAHATPAARRSPARGWRALDIVFGRVSFAVTFVVACALLGLFLAEMRVSRIHQDRDRQLAETYQKLIDPLLVVSSNRTPSAHPGS